MNIDVLLICYLLVILIFFIGANLMKKTTLMILILMLVFSATTFSQKKKPAQTQTQSIELKTKMDTLSYSLGMQFAKDLMQNNVAINPEIFSKALADILNKNNPSLSDDQVQEAITNLNNDLRQKDMENQKVKSEENLKKANEFLQKSSQQAGVKVTPSGLQYKEILAGTGATPKPEDTVEVHYTGKLIDGKVFDSSVERGQTIKFPLNQVIKGWTEGLQMMKEGGKAMLFIPPDLGYGDRGAGGVIGPNEALIFEVELIKVFKKN